MQYSTTCSVLKQVPLISCWLLPVAFRHYSEHSCILRMMLVEDFLYHLMLFDHYHHRGKENLISYCVSDLVIMSYFAFASHAL